MQKDEIGFIFFFPAVCKPHKLFEIWFTEIIVAFRFKRGKDEKKH